MGNWEKGNEGKQKTLTRYPSPITYYPFLIIFQTAKF